MPAKNRLPKPRGIRAAALFHTVWISTAALVIFDISSDNSTIRSFVSPRSTGEFVVDQGAAARLFGGKARVGSKAPQPAHAYFNFKDTPEAPPERVTEQVNLVGQWTGAVAASNVGTLWKTGGCEYEIRSLDFKLRSSGQDVFGYGAYSMLSEKCPNDELMTRYASATGKLTSGYLKLNIKNNGSGKTDLVYYGTVRPEGIVGQVRSAYGELMAEHVTLVRR